MAAIKAFVAFMALVVLAGSADAWVAVGRRPRVGFGRGVGVVAYRPRPVVYRRPVFYGRRLLDNQDDSDDKEEEDGAGDNTDVKECPIDIVNPMGSALDPLVDPCNDPSSSDFCKNCLGAGQAKLSMAWADHRQDGGDLSREFPAVVDACGQAVIDHLKTKGLNADDAFYSALNKCGWSAAGESCPISSDKLDGEVNAVGKKCLAVFYAAEGDADQELDQESYCSDCYWAIFKIIVNDRAIGDDFWCTFKQLNETGAVDTEEGERKVFDALYDDADFISCSHAVVDKMRMMDENSDGEPDEIDPLADPFAVRRQKGCWEEDNKPEKGSMLSVEMREYVANLECPSGDSGKQGDDGQ